MKHFYKYQKLTLVCIALALGTLYTLAQDYDFETNELGLCVMEAENYSAMVMVGELNSGTESYWDTASSPADYSGEGGMKAVNPGAAPGGSTEIPTTVAGYLRYNINFAEGGNYYVWARASKTGGSDDSYHAALCQDDVLLSSAVYVNFEGDLIPAENTGVWVWTYQSHATMAPAFVMVPAAGVYNFRIYIRERGFRIDKIVLARNPGFIPDSYGPDETRKLTGVKDVVSVNPNQFKVYPNPFSSATNISYKLDVTQQVRIKVLNALGEEIYALTNEMQQAGEHNFCWNLSATDQLKSGIYFIQLITGDNIQTVKTIITK